MTDLPSLSEYVSALKLQLSDEISALRRQYEAYPNALRLLQGRATSVDCALQQLWQKHQLPEAWVLLAVGGYGRQELYPYSDIDLLILLPGEVDDQLQDHLSHFVGTLWDLGLTVGQSVRTIEQCLLASAEDITVQTNLLESRYITGCRELFEQFKKQFAQSLDLRAFYNAKLLEQQQRYTRQQDTPFALEPNCKESPGGLRDIQILKWIARAANLGDSWHELTQHNLITPEESRGLNRAERFLQNVRIRLHFVANRAEDRLLFDYQEKLANTFGIEANATKRASERFMQRYFLNAKFITQINTLALQNFGTALFPTTNLPIIPLNESFQISGGLLDFRDPNLFEKRPEALLQSFLLLAQHPTLQGFSAQMLRALWHNRNRINARFRLSLENRELFLKIFQQPIGLVHTLRRMNQYDILSHYLPAWRKIVGQMQYDLFHAYTVDQHILMVIRNLRRFTMSEHAHEYPLQTKRMLAFDRAWLLYIAALFHDIAKGRGGDHSKLGMVDAQIFCKQHGLSAEDSALIIWLVENHLAMSHVAQKEDTTDPLVILRFSQKVKNERYLTALYLLTHADIRGTSPKVWNGWKGKLLEDLYFATQQTLQGATPHQALGLDKRREEAQALLQQYGLRAGVEKPFWDTLDTAYFMRHSAEELAWHTRILYHKMEANTPIVKARVLKGGEGIQVMVFVPDQKDLFVRLTGFFGKLGFSILEAKIHTTKQGRALDSFVIQIPGYETDYRDHVALIEYDLTQKLTNSTEPDLPQNGRLSRQIRHFPVEPTVTIQPDESGKQAILTITAADRPGLLHKVAKVLSKNHISLSSAKITTLGERVEDIFLMHGVELLSEAKVVQFEQELLAELQLANCAL